MFPRNIWEQNRSKILIARWRVVLIGLFSCQKIRRRGKETKARLYLNLGEFRDQHNNNKQTASAVLSMPPESMTSPECEMIPDLENGAKQDIPAASLNSTMPMPRTKGGKHLRWCRVSKEVEIKDATRFVCL